MTELVMATRGAGGERVYCGSDGGGGGGGEQRQVSMVAVLMAAIRKSLVSCHIEEREEAASMKRCTDNTTTSTSLLELMEMDIGWPTNVKHIAHVTFDRFNGFLGLPVEFEVEVPCRVPSASASVFGVSAESMQCSYDSKRNSVPTILLLMQERLYSQGGLKAEGIFRINPENSQEEHVRDQLNRGIVPDNIDVHCLAGLIKAWFRELPSGVLDGLSPEEVLRCNTEEESAELVKQLKPTEAALLNWAVELMADVVEEEDCNKMNTRNIAMVFAPNMTQMADPLTALMHAVQVMNLLKTLITKTLREREEGMTGSDSPMSSHSSGSPIDEDDYDSREEMESLSYGDHQPSKHSDDNEEESLSEAEECFLKRLSEGDQIITDILIESTITNSPMECSTSCSGLKTEESLSFTNSKNEKSSSTTTDDEEDSGITNRYVVRRK